MEMPRRKLLQAAGTSIALLSPGFAMARGARHEFGIDGLIYEPPYPKAKPRLLLDKLSEVISLTDFGGKGDYKEGAKGTDNRAALAVALAVCSELYLPVGRYRFTGWGILRALLATTFYGPGQLFYDNDAAVEPIGSLFRAGVCDPDGNLGTLIQGGLVVGGEGPGVHGSLLHAQHPSWPILKPTRSGSSLQFQLYSNGHIGAAKRISGRISLRPCTATFARPILRSMT